MVVSTMFLIALGAAALASALYILIGGDEWKWRRFFALTAALAVILFVILTGGAVRIG